MDGGRIQRLLNVHLEVDIVQKKLQRPLILTVAAGCAEDHKRLAVTRHQRRRQRRTGTFARAKSVWTLSIQVEHLAACAQREAQTLDHRRRPDPASTGRGGHHVAFSINGIQVCGISHVGMPSPGARHVVGCTACKSQGSAVVLQHVNCRPACRTAPNVTGTHLKRRLFADQRTPSVGIVLRKQNIERRLVKIGIAVIRLTVGKGQLGALDESMQVLHRVVAHLRKIEPLQQRQLLEKHRPLRPRRTFVHVQTAIIDAHRRLDGCMPFGHVVI